ncbi:glycerol-3-phosphate 1-O-acyltransferase PlsY [Mitsuaria sp. GD03876]|uniref:glycerol-3-phosphate 1-O-acyltransferase PlsY n=1 Tax=Mitsuaria sp. GD03876 TaxID=2975399 RepID=UPI00244BF622|nr:glycerol-3-phosphate 1-O-acyltransferase PlsY [Mitsuaria sp. GD03876]MDH0865297.1 glycerol-3-phosphate 1-O-acyltransferase PlsY [Mitsuaria sp. GD03876]
MQSTVFSLLAVVAGYLIGSLSFAVIVSRLMGLSDPRSYGSGNPGATNVLRSGNKAAAILTLVFDALKGFVPVLLVLKFGAPYGLEEGTAALVGLAAFVGHLWPVFFKFIGGKGVATAAGVLLAINPWLGLAVLGVWIAMAVVFRYSSLASLSAAVAAPLLQMLVWEIGPELPAIVLMSLLLIWRHAANIRKLMAGTESKLGQKSAPAAAAAAAAVPAKSHRHEQSREKRDHKHSHKAKQHSK